MHFMLEVLRYIFADQMTIKMVATILWDIRALQVSSEFHSTLLALREKNPPVTAGFPSQRPVTWSFDVFFNLFWCTWTNGWANKRDASDFRCHQVHYDVTVMRHSFSKWSQDACMILHTVTSNKGDYFEYLTSTICVSILNDVSIIW